MTTADRAKQFYDDRLRGKLEPEQNGRFVAIDPESGSHYLADTFVEAALASRQAFPSHAPFVIRIGHDAAFHLGASGL